MSDPSTQRIILPENRFAKQKQLIEGLVGSDKLQELYNRPRIEHPLKNYIDICNLMIDQNELIHLQNNLDKIPLILTVSLDSYIVSKCSSGEGQNLSLGNFENYGNDGVVKRIKNRILNPNDFPSLMAEFFCAARFTSYPGRVITALSESEQRGEKTPDFLLTIEGLDKGIAFDCKRIRSRSQDRAIGDRITDANRQIRSYSNRQGEVYGVALIDVSEKLRQHINNFNAFHGKLNELKEIARNQIRNQNTSLSGVLLVWDHFNCADTLEEIIELYSALNISTEGSLPEKLLLFIRSGEFIPHDAPNHQIPSDFVHKLFNNWGMTTCVDFYN
ncbi:hypothetical protein RIF25_00155 [Thermosynechococcaceae cyanobacterium BACA0444]|uniref:Uncharacterized protein n=1 Tax=Pseudocalidococcus azoricus BACA0444 TaxID=2918990 RepID=A0AAE4FQP4_9CYAN|nr:hypothetical protein [Pseudocalidococcus azoricus]MDS3859206.1 hypothetical protein [Pseudocalidococcus azoricus BACA0444]